MVKAPFLLFFLKFQKLQETCTIFPFTKSKSLHFSFPPSSFLSFPSYLLQCNTVSPPVSNENISFLSHFSKLQLPPSPSPSSRLAAAEHVLLPPSPNHHHDSAQIAVISFSLISHDAPRRPCSVASPTPRPRLTLRPRVSWRRRRRTCLVARPVRIGGASDANPVRIGKTAVSVLQWLTSGLLEMEKVQREKMKCSKAMKHIQQANELAKARAVEIRHLKSAFETTGNTSTRAKSEAPRYADSSCCKDCLMSRSSPDCYADNSCEDFSTEFANGDSNPFSQASIEWYLDEDSVAKQTNV